MEYSRVIQNWRSWKKGKEGQEDKLDKKEASRCRALVARANYLQTDRPDVSFATKELARGTAEPTKEE